MDFWVAFWSSGSGVDVVSAKVASDVERIFDGDVGEILVTECYDFLLGHEEGELVLAGVG